MANKSNINYDDMQQTSERNGRFSIKTLLVFILLIIVIALVILIAVTYGMNLQCDDDDNSTESNNLISFFLFSDVHLDQFYKAKAPAGKDSFCRNESKPSNYDAPIGRIGCDSPLSLLNEVLNTMKEQANKLHNLDFIMLSGDTCAHRIYTNRRNLVLESFNTTSKAVQLAFPDIPYFPNIGNNDIPGHYIMPSENDTWYADMLNIWEDGILCKYCKKRLHPTTTAAELRKTFLYGGYYSVSIAGGKMTLLMLNSMYWTWSTWRPDDYFQERAMKQIKWIEEQLKLAKSTNKKVILCSHIPPGCLIKNIEKEIKRTILSKGVDMKDRIWAVSVPCDLDHPSIDTHAEKTLWLGNFTDLYMDLVAERFSEVVAGQVYAHFHKDSFRFLQPNKTDTSLENSSYILLMPSLSVVYRNNPNFRIVHLDPDLRAIKDYEQWYMNLVIATEFNNPVWQLDYKFSSRYPPNGSDDQVINGKRIKILSDNLINQSNDSFFNGFISSRQVRYQPDSYSRFKFYCAVRYYNQDDYNACRKKYLVPGG